VEQKSLVLEGVKGYRKQKQKKKGMDHFKVTYVMWGPGESQDVLIAGYLACLSVEGLRPREFHYQAD
jgi:hypothetical protein